MQDSPAELWCASKKGLARSGDVGKVVGYRWDRLMVLVPHEFTRVLSSEMSLFGNDA